MTVCVAVINHRHGIDCLVEQARGVLESRIAEYCRKWWDETKPEPDPIPSDEDTLISEYFELMCDQEGLEVFNDIEVGGVTQETK